MKKPEMTEAEYARYRELCWLLRQRLDERAAIKAREAREAKLLAAMTPEERSDPALPCFLRMQA